MNFTHFYKQLIIGLGLLLGAVGAQATSIIQQNFDQVAKASELVFEGEVSGIESRLEGPRMVVTYVHFDIIEVLRGRHEGKRITLKYLGGRAEGKTLKVAGMGLPKYGEHGVYFVRQGQAQQAGIHPLSGWGQGHYLVKRSAKGRAMYSSQGRAIVSLGKSAASKHALSHGEVANLNAATGTQRPMSLQAFKARLKSVD
ncbi:MAG: hypothetical protein OIF38_10450 [Cellvibrionaceae bacterium]|nr:hypothetical protein [Cellvibrionaceae bacterium]